MKKAKKITIEDNVNLVSNLQKEVENELNNIPHNIWTSLWETKPKITMFGDTFCFGGDYKSLEEVRESIKWLADKFGVK